MPVSTATTEPLVVKSATFPSAFVIGSCGEGSWSLDSFVGSRCRVFASWCCFVGWFQSVEVPMRSNWRHFCGPLEAHLHVTPRRNFMTCKTQPVVAVVHAVWPNRVVRCNSWALLCLVCGSQESDLAFHIAWAMYRELRWKSAYRLKVFRTSATTLTMFKKRRVGAKDETGEKSTHAASTQSETLTVHRCTDLT